VSERRTNEKAACGRALDDPDEMAALAQLLWAAASAPENNGSSPLWQDKLEEILEAVMREEYRGAIEMEIQRLFTDIRGGSQGETTVPQETNEFARTELINADEIPPGDAFKEFAEELKYERANMRSDAAIVRAIADAQASIERHIDLKLLELRIAYEKANSDMLLRLGGVMVCVISIAIAAARFLGIVY
jgi:hypothetical protein